MANKPQIDQYRRQIIVSSLAGAIAPSAHAEPAVPTALIGLAMPLATQRGQSLRDAAQHGVDDANRRSIGINGKQVHFKLFEVDDKNDNNHAALAAQALVSAKVLGVVGHLSTDASLIGAGIYHKAGIPLVSPTATARSFTQQGYDNVFQLLGHTGITTGYLARVATQVIGAKRIMVIDNETGLGTALANGFIERLPGRDQQVVARASINQKSSDLNAALSVARLAQADLVFLAAIVPQALAIAQRLSQQLPGVALLLAGGAVNYNFPTSSDEYGANTWIVMHGLPEERLRGFKALQLAYARKFKTNLIPQSLFAYDCVGVLAQAVQQSQSLDPARLIKTLHRLQYAGVSGPVSFDAEGSLREPSYSLYRVERDRWTLVQSFP